jgi:cold shock protein
MREFDSSRQLHLDFSLKNQVSIPLVVSCDEGEMTNAEFVTGAVKWFDPEKGYGFVIHEGKDVFLHSKRLRESGLVIIEDQSFLEPGDKLKFKIESGPKGCYAVQISKE